MRNKLKIWKFDRLHKVFLEKKMEVKKKKRIVKIKKYIKLINKLK